MCHEPREMGTRNGQMYRDRAAALDSFNSNQYILQHCFEKDCFRSVYAAQQVHTSEVRDSRLTWLIGLFSGEMLPP